MPRLQFRYVLLTYAQAAGLDTQALCNLFNELNAKYVIGRENHADGGIHYHCFLDFGKKWRSSNMAAFDVEGYHPNISPSKGRAAGGWRYATKDGDIVAQTLDEPTGQSKGPTMQDRCASAISADTRAEFDRIMREELPDVLLRSYTSVKGYATDRFTEEKAVYQHPECLEVDTSAYPDLHEWYQRNVVEWVPGRRGQSLVLIGPSRLGKTVWARSLSVNHTHHGNMFSLDNFDPDVDYAVFDDIDIDFLPSYKCWLGHQQSFTCTDKYRSKRTVTWGKPCIWLSNVDPRTGKNVDQDWMDLNCKFVFIESSLVKERS